MRSVASQICKDGTPECIGRREHSYHHIFSFKDTLSCPFFRAIIFPINQSERKSHQLKSKILAEDQHILVCYKPPGLAVQSGRIGEPDMVSELKNYLGGRNPYLGLVHRLDQPVSGILVFAKTPQAAAKLSQQAAAHGEAQQGGKNQAGKQDKIGHQKKTGNQKGNVAQRPGKDGLPSMEKGYMALVYIGTGKEVVAANQEPGQDKNQNEDGHKIQDKEIKLVDYLLRDAGHNTSGVVKADTKGAKRAELLYEVVEKSDRQALVRIRLLTGRHHQIRVQFANAGLPLLGDARYGTEESREYSAEMGYGNICLCAFSLSFYHPVTGKRMDFQLEELPWIRKN